MKNLIFRISNIKLKHVFVFLSLIFGICFVFINGPFQSPDEYAHFYRAYQISEGHLLCEHYKNENGAYVPVTLVESKEVIFSKVVIGNKEKKFRKEDIITSFNTKLNPKKMMFMSIPNTAAYCPILYLPQAMGIEIGKILNQSPLMLMYLGRFFNLIFSTTIIYFAIKNLPVKKNLLFLYGLIPMLLYQSASLSADGFTNSICIFTITYFAKLAISHKKSVEKREIIAMFLLVILVSLTKQVYFLITLLYFLIPKTKFKSKKHYITIGVSLILVTALVNLLWAKISGTDPTTLNQTGVVPKDQIVFILAHPLLYIKIFIKTLSIETFSYINSFIGVLGWLEVTLPKYIVISYVPMLIIATLNGKVKCFDFKQRKIMALIFLATFVLIMTAIYVTWTSVGGQKVIGIQGRYFIPIVLLLLLAFDSDLLNIKDINVVIVLYSVIVLTVTSVTLYHRFFV